MESELLKQTKKTITVKDIKIFYSNEFTRQLYHLNLCEHIELAENANTAYNIFHKRFLSLLNKHAPYKSLIKREINISQKPWLTKGILTSINIKRKLFKTFKNSNQNEIYIRYKKYRDLFNLLIRKSKKIHYKVFFEKKIRNSKNTWSEINNILINRKRNQQNNYFIFENGKFISDRKQVANKFNHFFTNVAGNLSKKIKKW